MAGPSHEYHRGEMDIHEQTRTFHSFLVLSKWGSLAIAVVILFAAMKFAAGAGWIASLLTPLVLLVVGIVALRDKKKSTTH